MNQYKLPNTVFTALAPEKLDRMIEHALTHQQVTAVSKTSNILSFPARAAWFTGTGAVAASLFVAISLMPTPHQTVSAEPISSDVYDLFAYSTLSQ